MAQAKAEAPGIRQAAARFPGDAPLRQDLGVGRDVRADAVRPVFGQPVRVGDERLRVARLEALLEVQAGEEMPPPAEMPVHADRGAAPGGTVAGEILVARIDREPRAALEQPSLGEPSTALFRPGGLRKLHGRLREQRIGGVELIECIERARVQAPDVFVSGGECAAAFEERQRLARAAERDERLRLAEQPVHVVRVAREQEVVLHERGLRVPGASAGARERVAGVGVIRPGGDRRFERGVAGKRRRRRKQHGKGDGHF